MPKAPKPLPPVEELNRLFRYDAETGVLVWRVDRGRARVGQIAGTTNPVNRYRHVSVSRSMFYVHRIAWKMAYGVEPEIKIDHHDCNRDNNAIDNLRLATDSANAQNAVISKNNTSGFKGVSYRTNRRMWRAQIMANRRHYNLGDFSTKEEAKAAYDNAAERLHGEFARAA